MRILLIHNDNINPDITDQLGTENCFVFNILQETMMRDNYSFDSYTHFELKKFFTENTNEYDVICIPFNLSGENYLEFTGFRLALHLRLTPELGYSRIPIVMLGCESKEEIATISEYKSFLFSPGLIFFKPTDFESLTSKCHEVNSKNNRISDEQYQQFLEYLMLSPPPNYDSRHSLINEWSIIRWSKALGVEEEKIKNIEKLFGSSLYLKYLQIIKPITALPNFQQKILLNRGKVMYVDDELDKGWDSIFSKVLSNQNRKLIGSDFKKLSRSEILDYVEQEVTTFKPEVVILDLRLHDSDFSNNEPSEFLGLEILKKIKAINYGIQVIMFSATDKIWNLQTLNQHGLDDFMIKESPELSTSASKTEECLNKVYSILDYSIDRKYLSSLFEASENIKAHLNQQKKQRILQKDFVGGIVSFLDLAFVSIASKNSDLKFDSTFVYYFLILETCSSYIIDDNPISDGTGKFLHEFRKNNNKLKYFYQGNKTQNDLKTNNRRIPYFQEFCNIIDYAGVAGIDPCRLVDLRNDFNHPDLINNRTITRIKRNDVIEIFKVVESILLQF